MAFVSAIVSSGVQGNKRVIEGTYLNGGGDSGGDIRTGLQAVETLILIPTAAVVQPNRAVVNETFPIANEFGDVTVVTDLDEDGIWIATGV